MGWWRQDEEGRSFSTVEEMIWGDGPADIFDRAISEIVAMFREEQGRTPTKSELISGLKFTLQHIQ